MPSSQSPWDWHPPADDDVRPEEAALVLDSADDEVKVELP
jgi:hypothetical protein